MEKVLVITLPDYFVRKISGYPAGIRMPQMTKWHSGRYTYKPIVLPSLFTCSGDPLNGGDYRYWCGLSPSSAVNKGYASCRGCGEVFVTKDGRRGHKNAKCGAILEEAYKRLRRSKVCIICQLATHKLVYGLPLCCKDCIYEWEYVTTTPIGLKYVLEEIKEK